MSKTLTTLADRVSNEEILTQARESARKLWLFGLGAYSLATRTSVETFDTLVREGKAFRPKAQRQIAEKSAELMSSANDSIDRGERLFKDRLVRPLSFLLLASKRDVEQISKRLVQLTAEVRKLPGSQGAPVAEKKPATKRAIKPAAASTVTEGAPTMAATS